MKYPDYNTYQKLYGRYLTKSVAPFFARSSPDGKRVLDLCAGGGQLTQYALDHGATDVLIVDEAPQMLNPELVGNPAINRLSWTIEDFFKFSFFRKEHPYDIAVCRQAVNYWFLNVKGEDIAKVIAPGGWFVFNTFGNKPSETPTVREYYHNGIPYKEISYLIGEKVHHVQTATGMPPHITEFDWIPQADYRTKLTPYFNLAEVVDGPSSMWYCQKL